MAFAAPAAGRVAAGKAATRSAGAAAKSGRAAKATTAPERAAQLRAAGKSNAEAARVLRDETGSTLAEARGLVDDLPDTGGADGGDPPASPSAPPAARRSMPSAPKVVRRSADAGGGLLLGAIAYVLVLSYIRGGPDGVKAWLRAKFLNQVGGAK